MASKTRWGAVGVLILGGVIVALQIGKAAIAVPMLQKELMLSLVVASWVIGGYCVLGATAGLPAGIAISLFSARRALTAGLMACGLGSLGGAFAENGGVLIASRIVEGCGFLIAVIAIPRLLRAVIAEKDSETVLALWGAYMPAGSALMMVCGPYLMSFGWQTMWVVNGLAVLAYALVLTRIDISEPPPLANAVSLVASNIRSVLGVPGPLLLATVFGIYTFLYAGMTGLLPTLLVERMGLSIAAAGAVSALAVAANALGNLSASALLRVGLPFWTIATAAFVAAGGAGFGVFSDALPVAAVAALATLSIMMIGIIPASIFAAAPKFAPSSARLAIVLGLITQASNIGILLGPPATAAVVQAFGWNRASILIAGTAAAGVAVSLVVRAVLKKASGATSP